jgi:tetratricopeptide (TPR) repeat protein
MEMSRIHEECGRAVLALTACLLMGGCVGMNGPNFNPSVAPQPSLDVRLERADVAYREARLTDAERMYREIIDQHPRLTEVWVRLGNIYTRQNQLDAAVRAYGHALQSDRHEGRAWYNLSVVYLKMALGTLEHASHALPQDSPYLGLIESQYQSLVSRVEPAANDARALTPRREALALSGTVSHRPVRPSAAAVSTSIPQTPAPIPTVPTATSPVHSVTEARPSLQGLDMLDAPFGDPPCWTTDWGCTE